MSNNQAVKFLVLGVILFLVSTGASRARADLCPKLFAAFLPMERTEPPSIVVSRTLITPAVARYVQLLDLLNLPENQARGAQFKEFSPFLHAMTWRENQSAPVSERNTRIFRSDASTQRPEYQPLTRVTRIVSKSERFEQMLVQEQAARDLRRGSGVPKNPVFESFRRTQDERKFIGPMTRAEMERAAGLPFQFSIVYAQLFKLMKDAGESGTALSNSVRWTNYVRPHDYRSLKHFAMIARAMNSDPESRRTADNLVLETLRTEFAPELDVTLDVGLSTVAR